MTDILPNLLAEAIAQLGEGLVVEHAPDDAVVEGELGADVTAHAVGAALAVTDVEETQIRQDADIEHGGLFFLLQKYSFESNSQQVSAVTMYLISSSDRFFFAITVFVFWQRKNKWE